MSDFREKAANEKFCSSCGEVILEKAEICPKCGVRQYVTPAQKVIPENASDKDWLTVLLLAFFLGVFGVHRFYVGKIGTGIIFVVLCIFTAFTVPGIWVIIDIIMIATEKFHDKEGKIIVQKSNYF